MSHRNKVFGLLGWGTLSLASAQVTSYDATTMVVTIPSVSVGASSYTQVTLKNRGNFVFDLTGATPQTPPAPGVASYDLVTNVLTLPAVKVGAATFVDVKLRNLGDYVFTLESATELPKAVSDEVVAYTQAIEAQFATAVPANGQARMALTDACWRSNGRTRAFNIADIDAELPDYLAREAYQIGRKVQNVQVLALRNRTNPDGSSRREIDVQFDVVYRDGTSSREVNETLLSGSSAGTAGCSTSQTGSTLRAMGNQQLVQTNARARNTRDERYLFSNGGVASPAVNYRRDVQFNVSDPMGNATYVVVTGAGPSGTVNGAAAQFSLKLLSPRVLRSAPELASKTGNFLNWLDDDSFRTCRISGSNVPVAAIADCSGLGATGNDWGVTTSTPNAAADQSFADQGWQPGAVYRFDVYNDDGWKAVNGQSTKTPIASYFATLDRLPYGFVEMTGKYPLMTLNGSTLPLLAANASSATPVPVAFNWTRPGTLSEPHHLYQVWEFHQGPKNGNSGSNLYPGFRTLTRGYPGTTATAMANFPVTARQPDQASKSYAEFLLFYSVPGSFNQVLSRISLQ